MLHFEQALLNYTALLRITATSAICEIKANTEMLNYSIFSCEPAALIDSYVSYVSVSAADPQKISMNHAFLYFL